LGEGNLIRAARFAVMPNQPTEYVCLDLQLARYASPIVLDRSVLVLRQRMNLPPETLIPHSITLRVALPNSSFQAILSIIVRIAR
jgi:hypothetical protein